ncbi:MAG: hypothetical protein FD170_2724 [Bacteroidetes bacterium]|nr:MAG: hypothetical protein FD170_2724 [Bacteroidota bacterium]
MILSFVQIAIETASNDRLFVLSFVPIAIGTAQDDFVFN